MILEVVLVLRFCLLGGHLQRMRQDLYIQGMSLQTRHDRCGCTFIV